CAAINRSRSCSRRGSSSAMSCNWQNNGSYSSYSPRRVDRAGLVVCSAASSALIAGESPSAVITLVRGAVALVVVMASLQLEAAELHAASGRHERLSSQPADPTIG